MGNRRLVGFFVTVFTLLSAAFVLNAAAPANDLFANAYSIPGGSTVTTWPATGATLEPGEPNHRPGVPSKSVWWRWEAPLGSIGHVQAGGSATNTVYVVYRGSTLGGLAEIGRGTTFFQISTIPGETYHIAAVAETNQVGEVGFTIGLNNNQPGSASYQLPGNLLGQPSFEMSNEEFNALFSGSSSFWKKQGSLGANVREFGAADGGSWLILLGESLLWQDFATVPGRKYELRFAFKGSGTVRVLWNSNFVADATAPAEEDFWHWPRFLVTASNTVSRFAVKAQIGSAPIDAFSAVWVEEPPTLTTQPVPASGSVGAAASFFIGVKGYAPLHIQWYQDGVEVPGANSAALLLENLSTNQAGQYVAVVTNVFGSVTSAPAALTVEAPTSPTLILQPYGDQVAVGGYFALSAAAIGRPPLAYQWYRNGALVNGATNRSLVFDPFVSANAGTYAVHVSNTNETVVSVPATLSVASVTNSGGTFVLANEYRSGPVTNKAPVFSINGITPVAGTNFVAQLYLGSTLALLRPVGTPSAFSGSGPLAGYFRSALVTSPTVPSGSTAFAQVRVWDVNRGVSYEEARALGGVFGKSGILQLTAGSVSSPSQLVGLQSFSLKAGLPSFVAGRIGSPELLPGGGVRWSLEGQPGYLYAIEKTTGDFVWRPFLTVTNTVGTVQFTDAEASAANQTLYRARILE